MPIPAKAGRQRDAGRSGAISVLRQAESFRPRRSRGLDSLHNFDLERMIGNVVQALMQEAAHRQPERLQTLWGRCEVLTHLTQFNWLNPVDEPHSEPLDF